MTVPLPLAQRVERMRQDLTRIELAIGPAYIVLRAMTADGYPAGRGDGRGSDIYASSTAAAALARFDDEHERIIRRVKVISIGLEDLALELYTLQRKGPEGEQARLAHLKAMSEARCSGGVGHDGYLIWGRPECETIIGQHSTSGICDACRMRRDRWEAKREREREAS